MKPLAANRLVLSRKQHRACTLSISRAELEQHLGPPLAIDDEGDGLGPRYRWECQGECGLEVLIDLPRDGAQEAVLWMKHLKHYPGDPEWVNRDRFILSPGHGAALPVPQ